MEKPIRGFFGEYRWLSNFWSSPISIVDPGDPGTHLYNGIVFPTVEHAYQACKSHDPQDWKDISECVSPGASKRLGRTFILRPDWDDVKVAIMRRLIWEKFTQHSDLKEKLIQTRNQELIEENTWGDTFWGKNPKGYGINKLGQILMDTRARLIRELGENQHGNP